jgi:hypothetical protein
VYLRDDQKLVGAVRLYPVAGGDAWAVGYWIDRDHSGAGLATEAASALVRTAFEQGAARIEIHCDPANLRSAAIARRLGFTEEALLRRRQWVAGVARDQMIWTLHADDFAASPAAAAPVEPLDAVGRPLLAPREDPLRAWEELRAQARRTQVLTVDEPDLFAVGCRFEVDDGEEPQKVAVELMAAGDRPVVIVLAKVCGGTELEAEDALAHNAVLAAGALCLIMETYFLRHAIELAALDWETLDRLIGLVGHEAARLRQRLRPRPAEIAQAVAHYCAD